MTYQAQHNAIRTRFNAQWGSTTPIAWPNVNFTPPNNSAWVRFIVEDLDAAQASFGDPSNNIHRYIGQVVIMIFTPKGQGDNQARTLSETATGIFRGWSDTASGVLFRLAPFVRDVTNSEDKWMHLNVICPFQRDSFQ